MNPHLQFLREDYLDQPAEVSIETLALCNARCTFCPYPTLERIGTSIPMPKIRALIAEMAGFEKPFYFAPFKVNEPLLDNRLITICREFNQHCPQGILRLFTNGSPLTGGKIDDIAKLERVVHLWVSLNSTDPVDYETLMGLSFENTAKKLDVLHRAVEQGMFPHPVVLSRVNQGDRLDNLFIMNCNERWPRFQALLIKRDGWLGYVAPNDPQIPDTPCLRWFELSILATGVASLCCMDGKGEFPIGNIHTHTLLKIYNHPTFRDRRERMISRKEIHPCATCTY